MAKKPRIDHFAVARLRAVHARPYMATALLAVTAFPEPGLGTMSIDRWGRISYDPALFEEGAGKDKKRKWTPEQAGWAVLHEIWHWLRAHHERFEEVVRSSQCPELALKLVNVCVDCEINDDLVEEGAVLPTDPEPCLPASYGWPNDLLAEEYWERVQQEVEIEEVDLEDLTQEQLDQHDQDNEGSGPLPKKILIIRVKRPGPEGDKLREACNRKSGSGAHGQQQPWEKPGPGQDGHDPEREPAIGHAEREQIADDVAREIVREADRSPGTVPARMLRWAKKRLKPPQVPWERELAALLRNALVMARGCVDYSYEKPSRRGNFCGVIMPAMVRPEPEATVVIDTSASMCEEELHAALCETEGVLRACGQNRVPVYCCDAAASPKQFVSNALDIKLIGGGGTDMGEGIALAVKDGANVVVVLTDGYTPWPAQLPRGIQLVVGIIGSRESIEGVRGSVPSYAKRVVGITTEPLLEEDAA